MGPRVGLTKTREKDVTNWTRRGVLKGTAATAIGLSLPMPFISRGYAASGKIVATVANGEGVDALGWDPAQRLIYIPAGRDSNVTVAHEDAPDRYSVVATVPTMRGAKTISVDPVKHVAYLFQPEYGPLPPGSPAPAPGSRGPRGPVVAAWFFAISH